MQFEWDLAKEITNLAKHGVSFAEAVECFSDPKGFVLENIKHSVIEKRLLWVGKTKSGRILTVRYTRRGEKIRIIGAGEWRKFRRMYYERTKN